MANQVFYIQDGQVFEGKETLRANNLPAVDSPTCFEMTSSDGSEDIIALHILPGSVEARGYFLNLYRDRYGSYDGVNSFLNEVGYHSLIPL